MDEIFPCLQSKFCSELLRSMYRLLVKITVIGHTVQSTISSLWATALSDSEVQADRPYVIHPLVGAKLA